MQTEPILGQNKGENQTGRAPAPAARRWLGLTAGDVLKALLIVVPLGTGLVFEAGRIHRTLGSIETDVGDLDAALGREIINRRAMINEKVGAVRDENNGRYSPVIVRLVNLEDSVKQLPVLATRLENLSVLLDRIDANVEAVRTYMIRQGQSGGRQNRLEPGKKNSARLQ